MCTWGCLRGNGVRDGARHVRQALSALRTAEAGLPHMRPPRAPPAPPGGPVVETCVAVVLRTPQTGMGSPAHRNAMHPTGHGVRQPLPPSLPPGAPSAALMLPG